ncbi:hypothetical protein [Stenotrophomonas sp. ATCM1_4]|uniref:hypothetical protein n=1 Tax=Stenotrophomonas sp. ATCM1_4 TaxID=2259330 RepID=UPI001A9FF857|nr:hypothetical protein [Stenotrophomonas sp. ATCM1_4]
MDTQSAPQIDQPTASQIIDALGGTTVVAKLCCVRAPSVSDWRKHGIPSARRQFLELLRPEAFSTAAITKRALLARLALVNDTSLAALLQLPRAVVEGWADDSAVPDSPELRALLSQPAPVAAEQGSDDPDASRIVPVESA